MNSRSVILAAAGLWGLFLGGGLFSSWVLWDGPLNPDSFQYYARAVLTGLPALSLLLLASASLASALALALVLSRLLARGRSAGAVLVCFLLLSTAIGGNVALWTIAVPSPSSPGDLHSGHPESCTYDVFLNADSLETWSRRTRATVLSGTGGDLGALVNALPKSDQVICFEEGGYILDSGIRVIGQTNVTLLFAQGATITATGSFRLLQIAGSTGVTVVGGKWVGPGFGNYSDIEIDRGSNDITVEGVEASRAGHDGILIRNDTTPDLRVSIANNYLHDNLRFGVQDYENVTTQSLDILITGNRAEDNAVGGIYTNGVGGARIVNNTVRNTAGTSPGLIGIGVTNGANDTVTGNRVENMSEYGIQVFYNNNTLVANNYSGFNAGASDQSGITNDHSFYATIANNTVVSNGLSGIHVERSWYVTVEGNNATGNGRFGIEFYHGDIPSTARATVTGNVCSRNGQAGIILNSGVDSLIASNTCLDNLGPGIFLYNDRGEVGSTGNVVASNLLGDDRQSPSARTQTYGIEAVNGSEGNTVVGNTLFNNTVSGISLVGSANVVRGNVGGG